jgi:hypothetical protein
MPGRLLPRLGRLPANAAALVELDHVVLPDAAIGQRHQEHLTRATTPDKLRASLDRLAALAERP